MRKKSHVSLGRYLAYDMDCAELFRHRKAFILGNVFNISVILFYIIPRLYPPTRRVKILVRFTFSAALTGTRPAANCPSAIFCIYVEK